MELKRLLEELRVEKDHEMTEKADVGGQLEGVENDLVTARRHHVHNFSISGNMAVTKLISWNGSWRCLRETWSCELLVLRSRLRQITRKS